MSFCIFEKEDDRATPTHSITMDTELTHIGSIRKKYHEKKGIGYKNYSYVNEMEEIDDITIPYKANKSNSNGINLKLKKDAQIVRECFGDTKCNAYNQDVGISEISLDLHTLLGPSDNNLDNISNNGDDINLVGFLMIPELLLNNVSLNDGSSTLTSIINKIFPLNDFNNLTSQYEIYIEKINLDFKEHDKIKICFHNDGDDLEILGTIVSIDGTNIIVNPSDPQIRKEYAHLEINREDGNLTITKDYSIKREDHLCYDSIKSKMGIYLFPDNPKLEDLDAILDYILPNSKTIINTNIKKYTKITNNTSFHKIISNYHYNLDDITHQNMLPIYNIFNNNYIESNKIHKISMLKYNEFLKKKPILEKPTDIKLIRNRLLDRLSDHYGTYPYYNLSIDSDLVRLNWLQSLPDNGNLYFKTIVKDILEYGSKKRDETQRFLAEDISKTERKLDDLKNELQTKSQSPEYLENLSTCEKLRVVKIYTSLNSLNDDNFKKIACDDQFLSPSQQTNIVIPGNYAILDISDSHRKLYQRIVVADSKELWKLNSSDNLDSILKSSKEFCNFEGQNLSEIKPDFFSKKDKCEYNEDKKLCWPKQFNELNTKINELEENLQKKRIALESHINIPKHIQEINTDIKKTNNYLSKFKQRQSRNDELLKYPPVIIEPYDPIYDLIYKKIDIYLEKISRLPDESKYTLMDELIEKYGRTSIDEENNHFVYCKYGSKKLVCNHHTYFIKILKNKDSISEILDDLLSSYGRELDGSWWCTNCGSELMISDYETLEGFLNNGARDVTHEELEIETDDSIEGGQLKELYKMLLDKDNSLQDNDPKTKNIMKMLITLTDIMGVKLSVTARSRPNVQLQMLCWVKFLWTRMARTQLRVWVVMRMCKCLSMANRVTRGAGSCAARPRRLHALRNFVLK